MLNTEIEASRLDCKRGDYCTAPATALADPSLHARAQEYRRKLSGRMKPLAGDDMFRIPKAKGYFATRKYDGEFSMIVFDGKNVISVNPGGTVRVGLPCFKEAERLLKKAKVRPCLLAGEIYVADASPKRNRVHHVFKILRAPSSESQLEKLALAFFDIIELEKWFGKGKKAHPAEHVVADKLDTVMEAFTEWVIGEGAEGIVVRHDQAGWFKIKLRHNLDAAIIGFSEGSEDRKGMLHDLLVAVMRDDGTFHEFARVGGGFTEEDRKEIFEQLRRRVVPSEYVAVNNDYVAYEMIEPGPVIELSALDLISENTRGGPVNKMVLKFDGQRFTAVNRMPLVSVISPQFVRLRDDKEANVEDVNIRQIADLVEVPQADKPARASESEPSKILKRTVYTKVMRGQKMVRKLLLWKTNKENNPDFPGYVVFLTDFSPNRQNPLERDIRISNTEAAAKKMFDDLAKKNFVGGWEKVV